MNKVKRARLKPLSDSDRLLVEILARGDYPFPPLRAHHWTAGRTSANRWAAMQQYLERGIQLPTGGQGSANVERQRELDALGSQGLLTITRAAKTKAPWIRLTAKGEERARSLAALPTLAESFSWLTELGRLADGKPDVMVYEGAMTDAEYTPDEAALIVSMAIPSLVRGWAETGSTHAGHAAYALTAAGIEALAGPAPKGKELGRDDAAELYYATYREQLAALATASIADPFEIGPIPLRLDEITCLPTHGNDE